MNTIGNLTLGAGKPVVCVPLMGKTSAELGSAAAKLQKSSFELVELRADHLEKLTEATALDSIKSVRDALPQTPVLFTIRTAGEGGEKDLNATEYERLLTSVLSTRTIQAIDIEFTMPAETGRRLTELAEQCGVFTILSSHDFQSTLPLEALINRLTTMHDWGADAVKLACMPQSEIDVLNLMLATATVKERFPDQLFITMSMGKLGVVSRLCGELTGSCLTFGEGAAASAPGQVDAERLQASLEELCDWMR